MQRVETRLDTNGPLNLSRSRRILLECASSTPIVNKVTAKTTLRTGTSSSPDDTSKCIFGDFKKSPLNAGFFNLSALFLSTFVAGAYADTHAGNLNSNAGLPMVLRTDLVTLSPRLIMAILLNDYGGTVMRLVLVVLTPGLVMLYAKDIASDPRCAIGQRSRLRRAGEQASSPSQSQKCKFVHIRILCCVRHFPNGVDCPMFPNSYWNRHYKVKNAAWHVWLFSAS